MKVGSGLDNGEVTTTSRALRTDLALGWIVGFGVVAAGGADWAQGQPPPSRLPAPVSGFPVFVAAVVLCVGLVTAVAAGRVQTGWKYGALISAAVAVAIADPTYASLLFAVPLIEIGRRAPDPERWLATTATVAVAAYLVLTEPTDRNVSELEAMFVLAIAMAIVVMLGHTLRENDQIRVAEARLVRMDERNRLAEELHDSLGHNLLATSIQLRNAAALIDRDRDRAAHSIDLASQAVADALVDTRFAVDSIRADGDGFSLERSLPDLVERVTPPTTPIDLEVAGNHNRLDQLAQITLYRLAQEALSNIVRHANASTASLTSTVGSDAVTMVISDDGQGFEESLGSSRAGLDGMRERVARIGGRVDVTSGPGRGTTLRASIGLGS